MKVREDRPDLLHVQYTAPIGCPVPVVVSVHDVSFLEHPEYFTRDRAWQLQWTVRRTVERAARILTGSEFSRSSILKVYGDLEEDKVVVVPNAAASEFRPISREAATAARAGALLDRRAVPALGGRSPAPQESDRSHPRLRPPGAGLPATEAEPGAGRKGDVVRRPRPRGRAGIRRGRPHPVRRLRVRYATYCSSTTPAIFSSSRLSTKVSDCPCWRPWPAGGR